MSIYDNNPPVIIESEGAGTIVPLSTLPQYARVVNLTNLGSLSSSSAVIEAEKFGNSNTFLTSATSTAVTKSSITSNGITFRDKIPTEDSFGSTINATAISRASQAVVSATSPPGVGSIVRCIDATGMLQITTIEFSVTAVSSSSFTLGYLNTSTFASAATASKFVVINRGISASPRRAFITAISKASSGVITLSTSDHGIKQYTQVKLEGLEGHGMTELNGRVVNVTAVNTTNNTITIDVNTTNFTTFAFPASSATLSTRARVVPVGVSQGNVNRFEGRTILRAEGGMILGSSVAGDSGDRLAIFTDAEIPEL